MLVLYSAASYTIVSGPVRACVLSEVEILGGVLHTFFCWDCNLERESSDPLARAAPLARSLRTRDHDYCAAAPKLAALQLDKATIIAPPLSTSRRSNSTTHPSGPIHVWPIHCDRFDLCTPRVYVHWLLCTRWLHQ